MRKSNRSKLTGKLERSADTSEQVYVGLDVHKDSMDVAILSEGEILTFVGSGGAEGLISSLEQIKHSPHQIAYEAGPTGYSLVRKLRENGFNAEVVAPGKTPRAPNQGNKSDALDAKDIARYLAKDMLTAVEVPTRQQERDRQITRLREQIKKKDRRCKSQISSFLLQHGIEEPKGLRRWSEKAVRRLKQIELPSALGFTLNSYVEQLQLLGRQIRNVENKIDKLSRKDRHREKARIAKTHPGVGTLTAMTFITELYRPERFYGPPAVAKFCGLAPHIRQSGKRRVEGDCLPAGREGLRRLLVQAAWVWTRQDKHGDKKYRKLLRNTGDANKAIIGVARHLSINLWCMITRETEYIPGGTAD